MIRRSPILPGLVAAFGAFTLLGLLDRLGWPFAILTQPRLQYALVLVLLALAGLVRRRHLTAAIAAVLVAVNVAVVLPQWDTPDRPAPSGGERLRVLVMNLLAGNDEYERIAAAIARHRPDVLGLVELDSRLARGLAPALEGFADRAVRPLEGRFGIGVYTRRPGRDVRVETLARDGSPVALATVELAGRPLTVVVVHLNGLWSPAGAGAHRRELRALEDAARRGRFADRLAICGDFNDVPWSSSLKRLTERLGLVSSRRGHGWQGSWPAWSKLLGLPVDDCLVSRSGLVVVDRRTGPAIGSDHEPLLVELAPAR